MGWSVDGESHARTRSAPRASLIAIGRVTGPQAAAALAEIAQAISALVASVACAADPRAPGAEMPSSV